MNKKNWSIYCVFCIVLLLIVSLPVNGIKTNVIDNKTSDSEKIVEVKISSETDLLKIIEKGLSILDKDETNVLIYASEKEITWLEKSGFNYSIKYQSYKEMMGWSENPQEPLAFRTYSQMTAE